MFFAESLGEHKRSLKPKTRYFPPLLFLAVRNLFLNCFLFYFFLFSDSALAHWDEFSRVC